MADAGSNLPSRGQSTPLVPPLYQSSVYTLPDLDALDSILDTGAPGFIYARDGHPNARHLAEQLREMENASWSIVSGSGMGAVTAALLTVVQQGDRIVASNSLYGRTTQLLGKELDRFGVKTTFVDARDLRQVRAALEKPAKVLFVETMSNPLLAVADVPALAELARAQQCLLMVDNTFATPTLCRPLDLGADFVVESLTKMIGGHSDVTLGVVCGNGNHLLGITSLISIWGLASNPFDCWLASRGLATLGLRMRAASENAAALADWLAHQGGVSRVVYPGRPDHPDYAVARRVLPEGCGNMVAFELAGGRDAVNRFMRQAGGIPFSPSLGHFATTCSHPAATSHRYVSPAERKRQGITDGLVRLSVGVEDLKGIEEEMKRGLA
ncbi:MAG TPA: aminotransferase class I/II-fold pyridoxal phosphate-dependent enzyme [Gemmataceae bacterium]|nr:aminotransferase class I/II-fold pyridoxal phosphate-dependent enzyme [Gemmataceae bacterium]